MLTDIVQLLRERQPYRRRVQNIVANSRYVVFYGCGAIFASIVETWMRYVGRPIDFCCDSNPEKWGQRYCDVPCISTEQLIAMKSECAIFVTVGKYQDVFDFLEEEGFTSVNLIYKYDLVASDYLDEQPAEFVAERLVSARTLFSDAQSLKVFDTIVRRAIGGDKTIDLMSSVCDPIQYFDRAVVPLSDDECYVDVGAYNGDTIEHFRKLVDGRYERAYGFELDPANFSKLEKTVQGLPDRDKVEIFNLGAWDSTGEVRFSIGKSQSTVGEGDCVGHVVPLDDVLCGRRVSFIKMDIEGAELHALRGGQKLIKQAQPKLAICVYHHLSHLWELPLYIRELLPDHQLFLRHYTSLEYETVCYAIPAK